MTKRLTHQLSYDAPLKDVAAMLADPAFREEVCDAQKVAHRDASVETGTPTTVTIVYAHSTDRAPAIAQKFVGEEIEIRQTETWPRPDQGTIDIEITGKPGEAKGSVTLSEVDGRTTQTVDLSVRVGIPLIGAKAEEIIADLLTKAYKYEQRVGTDYLSR